MSAVRVGAITIGQSPRDDVVPDLSRQLGPQVEIVQVGALDGLTLGEVLGHPPFSGETTLVTRMRDGTEVAVEKSFAIPRLQAAARSLEDDVQLLLLLCTAPFDELESTLPLLRPAQLLEREVSSLRVQRLGVLTPSADQASTQRRRWRDHTKEEAVVVAASPYLARGALEEAATELIRQEVDVVVMDCIGYTSAMLRVMQNLTRVPVLSAQAVLGRAAAAMLEEMES